jgi:hypothetical protein
VASWSTVAKFPTAPPAVAASGGMTGGVLSATASRVATTTAAPRPGPVELSSNVA